MVALAAAGRALNTVVSLVVFSFLDLLDTVLCVVYKLIDFTVEREWKSCYCFSSSYSSDTIVATRSRSAGRSNVIRLCSATNRLQLDSISDTLRSRPSLLSDLASFIIYKHPFLKWPTSHCLTPSFLEIPSRKPNPRAAPRWSDCDCKTCASWSARAGSLLYVRADGNLMEPVEDVVFIHGFISSSVFWTETVFPEFSDAARTRYRLLAVDLLGFGRSPKPEESLYTMREHVEMIELSVLRQHGVRRFHIVAHSLGSVLALALAARHPASILSLTLLAPPYFAGEEKGDGGQSVMRRVAPRRIWPPMAFAASMACWYEHVSRTICLVICRQHRLWNFIFRLLTLNRVRTFLIEGFMCHTHNAAWHTLHNVICGNTNKMDTYLDALSELHSCHVNIFHGQNDELVPIDCSYAVQSRVPQACLRIIPRKDHITVVVGRAKTFAEELEKIWEDAKGK